MRQIRKKQADVVAACNTLITALPQLQKLAIDSPDTTPNILINIARSH